MPKQEHLFCHQYVREDGCATAADVLCHADFCPVHLCLLTLPAQLLHDFNDLVDPGRPYRMTARFQPAAGADGNPTGGSNLIFEAKANTLTALRKSASFETLKKCRCESFPASRSTIRSVPPANGCHVPGSLASNASASRKLAGTRRS